MGGRARAASIAAWVCWSSSVRWRGQPAAGSARNRAKAAVSRAAQGQRAGRCSVRWRAERVRRRATCGRRLGVSRALSACAHRAPLLRVASLMITDSPPVAIPRLYECPTPRSDGLVLVEDLAAQVDAVAADLHWSGAPTKLACRWSMRRFDQTSGPATSLAAEAAAGFVSGGIDRDEPRQRRSALSPVAEPGARQLDARGTDEHHRAIDQRAPIGFT
jgi:hypothetical protein